jgi:hypothetical protein
MTDSALAMLLAGILVLAITMPEFIGRHAHESYNGIMAGWESVR